MAPGPRAACRSALPWLWAFSVPAPRSLLRSFASPLACVISEPVLVLCEHPALASQPGSPRAPLTLTAFPVPLLRVSASPCVGGTAGNGPAACRWGPGTQGRGRGAPSLVTRSGTHWTPCVGLRRGGPAPSTRPFPAQPGKAVTRGRGILATCCRDCRGNRVRADRPSRCPGRSPAQKVGQQVRCPPGACPTQVLRPARRQCHPGQAPAVGHSASGLSAQGTQVA